MASALRRSLNLVRAHRPVVVSSVRSFSSDALVEVEPEVALISGIPEEQRRRRVIIYSPARTASQQGSGKVGRWKIDFLSTQNHLKVEAECQNCHLHLVWGHCQRWENPLMGWTSTGDPYANVGEAALSFDSEAAAIAFAEKYGWEYVVKKLHTPLLKPKSYAENFKWRDIPKSEEDD